LFRRPKRLSKPSAQNSIPQLPLPAHITLLYPFKPPAELGADVLGSLQTCFASFAPFTYALAAVRRFGSEVLYLAPQPDEPFRELTRVICQRYPETPPYGGKFADVIPHLTVAQVQNDDDLDHVAEDFALAARGMLPITATALEVALMDNRSDDWQIRDVYALGRMPANCDYRLAGPRQRLAPLSAQNRTLTSVGLCNGQRIDRAPGPIGLSSRAALYFA
jgi:2'-5' RNA ligase